MNSRMSPLMISNSRLIGGTGDPSLEPEQTETSPIMMPGGFTIESSPSAVANKDVLEN